MKFIDSSKIDKKKWDELILNSPKNNVYCYSWFLDATTEKWGAIINEDYSFGFPLPYKNRFFYKKIFQHPYGRNLEFFGNEKNLPQAIAIIKTLGVFSFHFNHSVANFKKITLKKHQELNLKETLQYKKNAIRLINKNRDNYTFKICKDYESLLQFYFENSFNKIKQQNKNKKFFTQLCKISTQLSFGEIIEAYNKKNELIASALFLRDKEKIYYVMGDCDMQHKKNGVMFSIMDFAINHYKNKYTYFDFGGSNIESVATFYKKLGGYDVPYFEYSDQPKFMILYA